MIDRVLGYAAVMRTDTKPTAAAGFSDEYVLVLCVSGRADRVLRLVKGK